MSSFLRREIVLIEFSSGLMLRPDGGCPADEFSNAIHTRAGENVIFCLRFVDRTDTGEVVAHPLTGVSGIWSAAIHSSALPADDPAIGGAADTAFNLSGDWSAGSSANLAAGEISFRLAFDSTGFAAVARRLLDEPGFVTAVAVSLTDSDGTRRIMAEFPIRPGYCPDERNGVEFVPAITIFRKVSMCAYPVFWHADYGCVGYLDANNSLHGISAVANATVIDLVLVSANSEITGNIVVSIGDETFTVAVGDEPAVAHLAFAAPYTGIPVITRNIDSANDTLRDTEVVTALVLDWSVRLQ